MTVLFILIIVIAFIYCLIILLYIIGWVLQKKTSVLVDYAPATSISVLIPARNEADNIFDTLNSILNCRYPPELLEVILIDDFSEDDTSIIATSVFAKFAKIKTKILSMNEYPEGLEEVNSFKKRALSVAINQAQGELIVTTDADTIVPENWLMEMAAIFEIQNANFIIAPVDFSPNRNRKKSLLYYFQSLDFVTLQGITAASYALKMGNMCNGANMGFRKSTYEAVGGYQGIDHIASGDDMLLLSKIRRYDSSKIAYLKSKTAIVRTEAQPTWRSFLQQRIRWASKAGHYKDIKVTVILTLTFLFNLLFPIMLLAGFWQRDMWILACKLLLIKTAIELTFTIPLVHFFDKKKQILFFPLLQPIHIAYIISAGFLGKLGKYKWKGRIVK